MIALVSSQSRGLYEAVVVACWDAHSEKIAEFCFLGPNVSSLQSSGCRRGIFMGLSECRCFPKTYNLTEADICEKDIVRSDLLHGILKYLQ